MSRNQQGKVEPTLTNKEDLARGVKVRANFVAVASGWVTSRSCKKETRQKAGLGWAQKRHTELTKLHEKIGAAVIKKGWDNWSCSAWKKRMSQEEIASMGESYPVEDNKTGLTHRRFHLNKHVNQIKTEDFYCKTNHSLAAQRGCWVSFLEGTKYF